LTNSISGIFFNVINEKFKKLITGIFNLEKWNFNFNSSIYSRNPIDQGGGFGSNVNASLGRSFLNNRIILTASGSVEGILQTGSSSVPQQRTFLPDVTLEILINPSGTFRAILFYRENTDYLTTTATSKNQKKTGIGLSYRKDVDHIGDLFRKKKNKQLPQPVEQKTEAITPDAAAKEEDEPEKK
jgi:hypothetical protein